MDYSAVHKVNFDNGYGASICIGMYDHGEFNVAVVDLTTDELCYDTEVTGDTVRCLSLEEVVRVVEQIKALPKRLTDYQMLCSQDGLCTSVAKGEKENAARIKCILDAFLDGDDLEMSSRCDHQWEQVNDLPCDFGSYRYRIRR